MALSKVQREKMEEAENLEGQSCENNRRNSGQHIVLTKIMRSTIKSLKPSQSTGVFPKVSFFVIKLENVLKGKSSGCPVLNRIILSKI